MPYATYRFNKIIAAETIRFIVTVAIVVYKGLKLVVYRMLTQIIMKCISRIRKELGVLVMKFVSMNWEKLLIDISKVVLNKKNMVNFVQN